MLNSVAAGRRLMLRAAVYPLAAVAVLALIFLLLAGPKAALGVLAPGVAIAIGGSIAARMAFGGGVQAAGSALLRLILGMVVKLVLVFGVLAVCFVVFKLPALALLAGVAVGLMFQALAMARL